MPTTPERITIERFSRGPDGKFSKADRAKFETFLRFPRKLYHGDRHWVPEWLPERKSFHDPAKNPELRRIDVTYFLAYSEDEPIGRITAHRHHGHNEYHKDNVGFFGFFECEDDPGAAAALFNAAEERLRELGCDAMRGPANFTSNNEWGMLIGGRFEDSPAVMMVYNPRYYIGLYERAGFEKARDLLAYEVTSVRWPNTKIQRIAEIARRRYNVTIRGVRTHPLSAWRDELALVRDLFNSAWEVNWGFVPLNEEEFLHLADDLRPVLHPDFCYVAEIDGRPVGFSLCIPDMHQLLTHTRARTLALAWHMFVRKSHFRWADIVTRIRIPLLGVLQEYRQRGVEALLYERNFEAAVTSGMLNAEISWLLEDNDAMNNGAKMMGAREYKRYRVWERPIAPAASEGEGAG
jgi:GNAT superfamily N-acetyltransferase